MIRLYTDEPTVGATDGTEISSGGDMTRPITFGPLNASTNEVSASKKVAIRTDPGYKTASSTTITPIGVRANRWQLAPDDDGVPGVFEEYGAGLVIAQEIVDENTIFWIRTRSIDTESAREDSLARIEVSTQVEMV